MSLMLIFKFNKIFPTHLTLYHPPTSPFCFFPNVLALLLVLNIGHNPKVIGVSIKMISPFSLLTFYCLQLLRDLCTNCIYFTQSCTKV